MAVETLSVCDPTLLADIRRYGKFDPTGCYQCGSCTLTCDLVDGGATFPRRSIRFALLGLRQPLVKSLDPWLCHDCGDCSAACPRQSEPRISMLTLRRFLSAQYDWTGIAPKLLQSTAWYLGSLIFVAALTFLLILGYHLWYVKMPAAQFVTTPLGLEHMFPLMTYYTLTVILVPLLLLLSRVLRIWRLTMSAEERAHIPFSAYVAEFGTYVDQSVTHSLMRKCHPDSSLLHQLQDPAARVLSEARNLGPQPPANGALRWAGCQGRGVACHPETTLVPGRPWAWELAEGNPCRPQRSAKARHRQPSYMRPIFRLGRNAGFQPREIPTQCRVNGNRRRAGGVSRRASIRRKSAWNRSVPGPRQSPYPPLRWTQGKGGAKTA